MSRGLTTDQKNILDDDVTIHETLLEITDSDGNTLYWTTGASDVTTTTPTSGGAQFYRTTNTLQEIDNINEVVWNGENRIGIRLAGDMSDAIGPQTQSPLNYRNYDTQFVFYKIFRNVSDNAIASADPILIFNGVLIKKTYIVGPTVETLQLDLISFAKFNNIMSPILQNTGLGA